MRRNQGQLARGWVLVVLALVVFVRIPSFWEPIGSDQAISALFADGLREGRVFYRDMWDQHTPLEFYIHALGQMLFGSSTRTVYLLDLLWTMGNTVALLVVARRLWGDGPALLGAALYGLFSNSVAFNRDLIGTWTMRVKPEGLMILPLALGLYAAIRATEDKQRYRGPWWGGTGLALGLAVALKPPAALFLIGSWIALLVWATAGPRPKLRSVATNTLWLAGGAILAQLTYLIPTALQRTLGEFWQAVILYNFGPYGELGLSSTRLLLVSALIGKETLVLWLVTAAGVAIMLVRDRQWGNLLVVGWGVLSGVVLLMQNRFYAYQYLPLLPPLCLLAAYGFKQLWSLGRKSTKGWVSRSVSGAVVVLLGVSVLRFGMTNATYYQRFAGLVSHRIDSDTFYSAFNTYPRHYSYPADKAVADYVNEHTQADESLATIGGYGATPVYLAQRPPASRFVFTYHLFHHRTADHPTVRAMREQFLTDLQASNPPFLLLFRPLEEFQQYDAVFRWIASEYELDRHFPHDRVLYRRRLM